MTGMDDGAFVMMGALHGPSRVWCHCCDKLMTTARSVTCVGVGEGVGDDGSLA